MKEVSKIKTFILLFILIAIGGLVLYGHDKQPKLNNQYETN